MLILIAVILVISIDAHCTSGSIGALPSVKGKFTVIENAQAHLKCDIPPRKPPLTIPLDYCAIKLKDTSQGSNEFKVLGHGDECKAKVGDEIKTELVGFDCRASLITCSGKENDLQWVYYLKNVNELGCHVEGVGYRFRSGKSAKSTKKK